MTTPPGMLAAGVLLWGWQSGAIWVALPLAAVLESPRWVPARWDITPRDFQRIADLCTWLFVFETAYFVLSKGWPLPILRILQWLPAVVAPLLVAQIYSSAGRVELSALFLSLRADRADSAAQTRVDLTFPYVGLCALAAGASNVRSAEYYAAVAVLAAWGLWGVRSPRIPAVLWTVLLACAIGLGYAGHIGLNRLQGWLFNIAIDYLQIDLTRTDPYRSNTDIGHIGELKESQRILLRVDAPGAVKPPILLHRASYNVYAATTWIARDAGFDPLPPAGEGTWRLGGDRDVDYALTISETLPSGTGVLALPAGTLRIAGLGAASLRRNRLGAVRVERVPGAVSYQVAVSAAAGGRDTPTELDLRIPSPERAAVQGAARELDLAALPAARVEQALQGYFSEKFHYATYRSERTDAASAITEFLLRSRSGHCEYFATATVLLARAAGIPARYATGFSVQEWSELEGRYVVRERHAHAWARLYLDGVWRDVDTTPAQWFVTESRTAPFWEAAADLWSWLAFEFRQWRADAETRSGSPWLIALLIALTALLVWRLYRGGRFARDHGLAGANGADGAASARPGSASAFYLIESHLGQRGFPRLENETQAEWLNRIGPTLPNEEAHQLDEILRLHYRLRFDPRMVGEVAEVERRLLDDTVQAWIRIAAARIGIQPSQEHGGASR